MNRTYTQQARNDRTEQLCEEHLERTFIKSLEPTQPLMPGQLLKPLHA
jgi:hypothetical protein